MYPAQAVECRIASASADKLNLALAEAVSDTAVARLKDWQQTELAERSGTAGGSPSSSKARLTVLRLQQDELGFRWVVQTACTHFPSHFLLLSPLPLMSVSRWAVVNDVPYSDVP